MKAIPTLEDEVLSEILDILDKAKTEIRENWACSDQKPFSPLIVDLAKEPSFAQQRKMAAAIIAIRGTLRAAELNLEEAVKVLGSFL